MNFFGLILSLVFFVTILVIMTYLMIYQFYYSFNPRRMVLFPTFLDQNTKENMTKIIQKYCPTTEDVELLEIGCGSAHTAHFLGKEFRWQKVLGVEVDFLTFQIARVVNHFSQTKIQLLQQDIFEYEFTTNSVLYCYLGGEIMKSMYNEGKFKNCLVITLTFPIENLTPTEKVELSNSHHRFFIYDFR